MTSLFDNIFVAPSVHREIMETWTIAQLTTMSRYYPGITQCAKGLLDLAKHWNDADRRQAGEVCDARRGMEILASAPEIGYWNGAFDSIFGKDAIFIVNSTVQSTVKSEVREKMVTLGSLKINQELMAELAASAPSLPTGTVQTTTLSVPTTSPAEETTTLNKDLPTTTTTTDSTATGIAATVTTASEQLVFIPSWRPSSDTIERVIPRSFIGMSEAPTRVGADLLAVAITGFVHFNTGVMEDAIPPSSLTSLAFKDFNVNGLVQFKSGVRQSILRSPVFAAAIADRKSLRKSAFLTAVYKMLLSMPLDDYLALQTFYIAGCFMEVSATRTLSQAPVIHFLSSEQSSRIVTVQGKAGDRFEEKFKGKPYVMTNGHIRALQFPSSLSADHARMMTAATRASDMGGLGFFSGCFYYPGQPSKQVKQLYRIVPAVLGAVAKFGGVNLYSESNFVLPYVDAAMNKWLTGGVCYYVLKGREGTPRMLSTCIKPVRQPNPNYPCVHVLDFGAASGSGPHDRAFDGEALLNNLLSVVGSTRFIVFTTVDSPGFFRVGHVYRYGPYTTGDMVFSNIENLEFAAVKSVTQGQKLIREPFLKRLTAVPTFEVFCSKFVAEMQARVMTYFNPLKVVSEFATTVVGIPKTVKFRLVDGKLHLDLDFEAARPVAVSSYSPTEGDKEPPSSWDLGATMGSSSNSSSNSSKQVQVPPNISMNVPSPSMAPNPGFAFPHPNAPQGLHPSTPQAPVGLTMDDD